MSFKTVPLSSLLPPKDNPRRIVDAALIAALAQSIKTDGVLQNLLVRLEGKKHRVIFGKRRYLALLHLKKQKVIDGAYKVPVEVKNNLTRGDVQRVTTVENVQREQLHPMDEAEAFAGLLQAGGAVGDISKKTGLGVQTIRRRLALANLSPEAKKALRSGVLTLAVAEALTVGSGEQQRMILEAIRSGERVDAADIRDTLLHGKPSLSMALFPKGAYTGTFVTDLFGDDETTYFEDLDQFHLLQRAAVDQLAEEHRKTAGWVEVLNLVAVPWWQYREAKKKESAKAGVVINVHPSGSVEVRTGLMRHDVKEAVVADTRDTPMVRSKERPAFSAPLRRYVAFHKSMAVQAALLRNPRKAKEIAVLLLLAGGALRHGLRLSPHPCARGLAAVGDDCPAYKEVETTSAALADRIGCPVGVDRSSDGIARVLAGGAVDAEVYDRIARLSDEEVDHLLVLLPVLCFGQDDVEALDQSQSLFNRVAADLAVRMREWWTPDATFLNLLRRDQLQAIAEECGNGSRLRLKAWSKTELVQALVRGFSASAAASAEELEKRKRWVPGMFEFPAQENVSVQKSR